jgi:hypothetical protein
VIVVHNISEVEKSFDIEVLRNERVVEIWELSLSGSQTTTYQSTDLEFTAKEGAEYSVRTRVDDGPWIRDTFVVADKKPDIVIMYEGDRGLNIYQVV